MKEYLFYLTFGPIQSFIAQSRKTRDLYAASQILSQLAKTAVAEIVKQQHSILIIPEQSNANSLPNYLLAKFTVEPNGNAIEAVVRKRFEEIAEQTRKKTGVAKPKNFDQHIKEHLEVHWAFLDLQGNYATAYKNLQIIVAGLKNTRYFCQIKNRAGQLGEFGRKCSLDGEHNALFYRRNSTKQVPPYIDLNDAVEITASKLRPNEGLSAASLVKRYYQPDKNMAEFPSTAAIALMHWCEDLQQFPEGKEALDTFQNCVETSDWDAQLLLQENLTTQYFDKNGLETNKEKLPFLQDQLKILDKFPPKKTSYYALLVYDGDKMGEHLATMSSPEEHQNLSKQLARFAQQAREEMLIPPRGKTLYAGGDDFLGFVNLHSIFSIIEQLRVKFNEQVNKPLKTKFNLIKPLTFSAGIVVAHYKMPLHIVLHNARDLLDSVAKEKLDRDAFAIRVLKHSGESHECGFKWALEAENTPLKALQYVIQQLKEHFSTNFIQKLNEEMRILYQETVTTQVIEGEIRRLIKRSVQKDSLDKEQDELIKAVIGLNDASNDSNMSVENFLEALNVCKFMHREIK